MNRSNYSPKVLSVFDTIGSFFIDVVYNSLYLKAKDAVREGTAKSITDAYRANVMNYMRGIQKEHLYKTVVKNLFKYYQDINSYGTIVFADFENKVVSCFIPPEYYSDFSDRIKDQSLQEIIIKTVNQLGELVLSREVLKRIIDSHQDVSNIGYLQDKIVDIFIIQREDYYASFAAQLNKKNTKQTVDVGVVKKLKEHTKEEIRRRCKAEDDLARALSMLAQVLRNINELQVTCNKQREQLERLSRVETPIVVERVERQDIPTIIKDKPIVESASDDETSEDEELQRKKHQEMLKRRVQERNRLRQEEAVRKKAEREVVDVEVEEVEQKEESDDENNMWR